jgi:hypothetical protein
MTGTIERMAARLSEVPGVRAVTLGGSRARGSHRPDSDWDLGIYYRGTVDTRALAALAAELTGEDVEIAAPGGWGPWVNGGAWLTVLGEHLDWILRDLDRVERVWADCEEGRFERGRQPGHPLGYWSHGYPGEVAQCRVLADPHGELALLRAKTLTYPEPLRAALAEATWEAGFVLAGARKVAVAGDDLYVGLSLGFAAGILTHALFGHHRLWCPNEKGALAAVSRLPGTPARFAERVGEALRGLDVLAVDGMAQLTDAVRAVVIES